MLMVMVMRKINKYISVFSSGVLGIIYTIIILFGGFIFPLLYLFCDIGWVRIICIVYASLYAIATFLGGNIIPYIIIFFINLFVLNIQGNSNPWLISFIEIPLIVSAYCLITGYFKKNKQDN